MQLYLLRHANADTIAARDDDRPLSEKGLAQAEKVARFCQEQGLEASFILSSPILRADQTARALAKRLRSKLVIVPWLACGMRPEEALKELLAYAHESAVFLVGHEPDFWSNMRLLLKIAIDNGIYKNIDFNKKRALPFFFALELLTKQKCVATLSSKNILY